MKNLVALIAFVALSFAAQAKFYLVNNNTGAIEKFKTPQAAYDSCSVGDTIYLAPSPNLYEGITIKKRIVLLGVGLKDKNGKILTDFSLIEGIAVDTSGNAVRTSGTIISGLKIYRFGINIIASVKNIMIFNCYIDSHYQASYIGSNNNMVFNNIFNLGTIYLGKNVNFHNNVVAGSITRNTATVGDDNCNIANNIFLGANAIGDFKASTFTNNIFYSTSGAEAATALVNSYANNVQGVNDLIPGNLTNVDMATVFAESTVGSATGEALIGLSFTLKAGSQALTYGVGGTEVGVYGNINPWPRGVVYTRSPGVLPVVTSIQVVNQTVSPGATLKFNLKAKSLK